jgi:two-component system, sensor histidine kinase and response regulator
MSRLGPSPGRLKGWLQALRASENPEAPSRPRGEAGQTRDLATEFERFVRIGDRLERRLEELKDLQWQIRESETRYRDMLDSQADVILRRDAEGRLTFVNQAFCRVFGRDRDSVMGQPFRPRFLAGDDPSPLVPDGSAHRQKYVQQIDTAAGPRWFEWVEHAVPASGDAPPEVQCVARDVTDNVRTQAELTEARRQAEEANKAKSRFLASVSHEIRTPMNGILGMTSLLSETELTQEQQTYAQAVDRSARTLLTLINEILDFSKIEAGKLVLKCEPLSIEECVQGVVELLAAKAYEKNIDIGWAIDPAVPRAVLGDEVRLRQVLINLIGNAIKFTDAGGVLVTVERHAASGNAPDNNMIEVAIAVEDTGMGIAADALPLLFQEFEQAEAAVQRRQGGTGLGLAISRRLAQAMGGDIVVTSEPSKGSTFRAVLRFRKPSHQATEPKGPTRATTPHVFLASDRPMECRAITLTLEGAGIPVEAGMTEAGRLIDAAASAGEPFTTIVVDRASTREDAGLLAHARQVAPGHAVQGIIVLDRSAKGTFAELRKAGFDAYLVRPVRPRSLLSGIETGFSDTRNPPAVASVPDAETRSASQPISVLLVEDNDINALLATRLLEKIGCRVRTCSNGQQAVEAFQRILAGEDAPIDLVLMDMHMPVMGGLDAARAIRQLHTTHAQPCPPIVAVTANAFDEDRQLCLEAGMNDYLTKPFDREDLEAVVDRWCGDKRRGAALI